MAKSKTQKRIAELERVCAELYQVIGRLADFADCWAHPDVVRAMDNAADQKLTHKKLLPWPRQPLYRESEFAAALAALKHK